jgi:hypothetical protein
MNSQMQAPAKAVTAIVIRNVSMTYTPSDISWVRYFGTVAIQGALLNALDTPALIGSAVSVATF